MTSRPATQSGIELIWVNASPTGPTDTDASDPTQHRITRVQSGLKKLVRRSSAEQEEADAIVNDLANTIRFLAAKTVSREHAVIGWAAGAPFVEDLGSTHGTFVARRHATFDPQGQVLEQDASAELLQVISITKLKHGDLVQFGKTLSRGSTHYYPVRCYVRFRDAPTPPSFSKVSAAAPTSVSAAKSSYSYGLGDATIDSEIVSIDAETFHKGVSPVTPSLPKASNSPTLKDAVNPRHFEQAEVEVGSSDSEQSCINVDSSDSDSEAGTNHSHSDSENICSCSECHSTESSGPGDVSGDDSDLPVRIDEDDDGVCASSDASASEGEEQDSSTMDSDQVDPAICVLRAPSTNAHTDTEGSESPIQESASIAPAWSSTSSNAESLLVPMEGEVKPATAKDSSSEAEEKETPIADAIVSADEKEEAQLTPSRKRALESPEDDRASTDESTGDEDDNGTDSDKSFEASSLASALSSPCTSISGTPSPPPAKKRRISDASHEDRRIQPRPRSRGRSVRVFVGKALYTASLLSIGFFSGSLFTFKSMLNAAAAANAAGSDRQ
ncbi:hypothetical protein L1887_56910 [Cichorium endivia]|nr:hypothetical protein L1887_56910 [Cichorium endivia]